MAALNRTLGVHGGYGDLTEYADRMIVQDLYLHPTFERTTEIMQLFTSWRQIAEWHSNG